MPNESNDGDSFHVKADGKEYIFRLYFVDAPETDLAFPDRVDEQAKYFAITRTQATQLGNYAKQFTKEELTRPFVVRTCMQDALGRSHKERFYAFIGTNDGDLSELLVANGMARLHGTQSTPVGLASPEREWHKLQRLESEAKQAKVGGWGAPAGRMTARLPKAPPKDGADSFDSFFHPDRVATGAEAHNVMQPGAAAPTPVPSAWPFPKPIATATPLPVPRAPVATSIPTVAPPPGPAPSGGKLDPNTAST
ncbi:MAG: thermonuclease family protein, partial [Verrucomicrobiota bacterium]|nr:thermonuclease family protein [Verrucomicrobiota bacterium]